MKSGVFAPDFSVYGLFRAKHVPLAHSALPNIRISWDYHPTFMLIWA